MLEGDKCYVEENKSRKWIQCVCVETGLLKYGRFNDGSLGLPAILICFIFIVTLFTKCFYISSFNS